MTWRYVSRSELLENLERAALGPSEMEELRQWVDDILVNVDIEIDDKDASLIHATVERLEVASPANFKRLAGDLDRLIRSIPDGEVARQLIPLIEERERVAELLQKVEEGQISRTAFLSFITERSWPKSVKNPIVRMNGASIRELQRALTRGTYGALPALLSMS